MFSKQFDNFQIFLFSFSPQINQIFIYEPTSDIIRNAHLALDLSFFFFFCMLKPKLFLCVFSWCL